MTNFVSVNIKVEVLIMPTKEEVIKALYPEDILSIAKDLTEGEVKLLKQLNDMLEEKYRDSVNEHWLNATEPEDYFEELGKLNYFQNPLLFEGREGEKTPSQLFQFFMSYTIAKFDVSLATLLGVHQGLGHNSFWFGGSKEQQAYYLPKLQSHELRTCFALTEPEHGSDVAGGLETTAKREGDQWVINGEKKWIGGANVADVMPVYAVDVDTGKPKGFIVEPSQEGVEIELIENKIALRIVPNAKIRLKNVVVKDEQPFFHDVKLSEKLAAKGALGNKTKQGFYKKVDKKRFVFDAEQNDYVPPQPPQLEILGKFSKDLASNLDVIFNAQDDAGVFLWETLRNNFYYSAINVPKAATDFKDIDRALVWGFDFMCAFICVNCFSICKESCNIVLSC